MPDIHSDGAKEMLRYQKLVSKVIKEEPVDTQRNSLQTRKRRIKLGAPELPRTGTREPKP